MSHLHENVRVYILALNAFYYYMQSVTTPSQSHCWRCSNFLLFFAPQKSKAGVAAFVLHCCCTCRCWRAVGYSRAYRCHNCCTFTVPSTVTPISANTACASWRQKLNKREHKRTSIDFTERRAAHHIAFSVWTSACFRRDTPLCYTTASPTTRRQSAVGSAIIIDSVTNDSCAVLIDILVSVRRTHGQLVTDDSPDLFA